MQLYLTASLVLMLQNILVLKLLMNKTSFAFTKFCSVLPNAAKDNYCNRWLFFVRKKHAGKTTCKRIAYVHVDSGAMYRAITLYFLRNTVNITKQKEIIDAFKKYSSVFFI